LLRGLNVCLDRQRASAALFAPSAGRASPARAAAPQWMATTLRAIGM
jgi:hypothetical protein